MKSNKVESAQHGKWIVGGWTPNGNNKPVKLFSCSVCKGVIKVNYDAYQCSYKYCPNCGAKMDLS